MPLELRGIAFAYRRDHSVFADLDIAFDARSTVMLGPNGAGKTTLLSLAATAIWPRTGTVSMDGLTPEGRRNLYRFRRDVAWIPQDPATVPGLRVREQVAYCGWLKGMSRAEAWEQSARALRQVRLDELGDRPSSQLSGGQRRRLTIAQALVHRATYVLMDEPTAGLDPDQRQVFRQLAADLRDVTKIVVSTHQIDDLNELYDDVVLINDGRIAFHDRTEAFLATAASDDPMASRAEAAYSRLINREA
jgi:ABC-type multidrug transport system ATPase subunit